MWVHASYSYFITCRALSVPLSAGMPGKCLLVELGLKQGVPDSSKGET